jgi:hypothetical protein
MGDEQVIEEEVMQIFFINAQPLHTHPEDDNCSACRNVG